MKALLAALVFLLPATASAEPTIGGSLSLSEPLADGDFARLRAGIYGLGAARGPLSVGAELAGSIGGYTGGYGCDTVEMKPGTVVPSVAVSCLEPSLGLHALAGYSAGRSTQLRVEAGLGMLGVATLPGSGGRNLARLHASGLVRASLLRRVAAATSGQWAFGVQLSQQVYDLGAMRSLVSAGLVLEAVAY